MSDLFLPEIPASFVARVWSTMARAGWHTFQVLTKRPERMPDLPVWGWQDPPLANVWLGSSIENRRLVGRADASRRTPAAVRFVSAEPLLGPFDGLDLTGIDWVIAGGESGPRQRRCELGWVRDLRGRCQAEGVAFCFKQAGGRRPGTGRELDGRAWEQFPSPPRAARSSGPARRRGLAGRGLGDTSRSPRADVVVGDVSLVDGGGGR